MRTYKTYPQVLIAIAANGGSFLYGITLGWSAPVGPQILSSSHEFVMTKNEFSWAVSMMPLGGAISSIISGIVRDRFGTKMTILMFAVPNLLGWLSITLAWNPLMIIIGRLLIGIASGAYCFNIPVFIGEIASKEIRGILCCLFQVLVEAGVLFVYTLATLVDLLTLNMICGSLLIAYTIGFMFLPESPVYLVRKNQFNKAEKSIKLLRGKKYDAQSEVLECIELMNQDAKAPESSIAEEFKKPETMKAFIIIICVFFFFQMSGINAVIFYTTSIFIEAGIDINPSTATIITGFVQVISTLSTAAFVDRFGRVFLLKLSFSLMILGLLSFATFFYAKSWTDFNLDWMPLPSLCIFVIGFSSGMGPVPFVLLGEIFSNDAKKFIAPFAQTMIFLLSFMIGLIYPVLVSIIGTGLTFFMFTGFCVAGLLFTIFVIPETKGKSFSEIQTLLRS